MITTILLALPLSLATQGGPDRLAQRTSTDGEQNQQVVLEAAVRPVVRQAQPVSQGPLLGTPVSFQTVNQDPENDMPRYVVFRADGSEALIAGRDTDTVSFFDVATQTITSTVDVGDFPVHIAVTPNNQYAVVTNVFDDNVSVIDLASHTVVANVPITGTQPFSVSVTADSAFAVVGVINDGINSSISVIDLASLTEVQSFGTVPMGVYGSFFSPEAGIFGNLFTELALSSANDTIVIPDRGNSQVALYDITNGNQIALLATADVPTAVAVSLDGNMAVIAHGDNAGTISRIDLIAGSLTGSFATGNSMYSRRVAITHDNSHAIAGMSNEVQFVNLTTGTVSAIVNTGSVGDIEISFDGQYAIVSNFNLRIIDVATQSLVRTIPNAPSAEGSASPIEHRFVAVNNLFGERIHLYSTDGAAGFLESNILSGELEEADAPRTLAISADGLTAIVANNLSDNAAIIDVSSGTVRAYVPTGTRSLGAAISADGLTAVVVNATSNTATVIDLTTDTAVANVPVPTGPAEVLISADGQMAFVTSVASLDRVHFIQLAGAASSSVGTLNTGQMGSIGYSYSVTSGLALSPDGSTLAVCISFADELMLIDTATMAEVARLNVGDFPIRARFSPDSTRLYVTHSFGDSVVAIDVNGAASTVAGTVGGIDFPLQVDVDATGNFSYVGSFNFQNPALYVIDNSTLSTVATLPLPGGPRSSAWFGNELLVTTSNGELVRIDAAGPASTVLHTVALSGSPSDLVFSPPLGRALSAQPGASDGLDIVDFGAPFTNYCSSTANSSGAPAIMGASGSVSIAANNFTLEVSSASLGSPGLFFYGPSQVQIPFGNGLRCVGGAISRLNPALATDGTGAISRPLDFTVLPASSGPGQILPGSTWNFQFWFRDIPAGGAGFDLSDGLSVTFAP